MSDFIPSFQPPPPQPQPQFSPPSPSNNNQSALLSLIFGLCGFLCTICAIPAIIFGHKARAEIKKNPQMEGQGMALAGLILGYAALIFTVVILLIYIIIVVVAITAR